ncbi:MAG: hypothetical protein QM703_26755 [Gemmatales bacterium]
MSSSLTPIAIDFGKLSKVLGSGDEALLDVLLKKFREKFEEVDELASELEEDDDTEGDEEDDEASRQASLMALSQLLGKAKQDLQSGVAPAKALSGLGQKGGLSEQHQKALHDLLSDSDDDTTGPANDSPADYASAADVTRHLISGKKPARRVAFKFMYGYALQCLCLHLGEELPHDRWHDLRGSTWAKSLDKALKTVSIPVKTLSVSKQLVDRGAPFKQVPTYSDNPSIGYLTLAEVERAVAAMQDARLDTLEEETRSFLEDLRRWLQTCADTKRDLICFGE